MSRPVHLELLGCRWSWQVGAEPELTADPDAVTCKPCLKSIEREADIEAEAHTQNHQHDKAHAAGFGDIYDWLLDGDDPDASRRMVAQILASVGEFLLESGYARALDATQAAA